MGDVEQADIPATATPDGSPAAAQGAGETPTATGNGAVVVSGQFPAGTVVKCYHVDSEATLRVDADATLVGERMSDDNGDVGFPGLEQGARYFVCGYVDGQLQEIRCVGQDPEAPNAPLGQPPVQSLPTVVGTQQEKVVPVPPAPPAEEIPVGIAPEAQPTAPDAPVDDGPRLFLHTADEPIDAEVWTLAPVRVVDDNRPDALAPLYTYTGADTALPDGWAVYSGPTEPLPPPLSPVAPEAPQETPEEGAAREAHEAAEAAASAAPVDAPNPPAPDAGTPDASESSGTGQANGGAIEELIAQTPPEAVTSGTTPPVPSVEIQPLQTTPPAVDPSAQAPAGSGQPTTDQPSPDASAPEVDQPAVDPSAAVAAPASSPAPGEAAGAAEPATDAPASS